MSNNDNAMARFLFAILKQKNLKDIDWNKVAHDPVLTQEISNGHAARMRYSRFRSAMLGLEPQRRNRKADNKNRVTKNKKETKPKRDDNESSKPAPASQPSAVKPDPDSATLRVKQEQLANSQLSYEPHFMPTPEATVTSQQNQVDMHGQRLLTPCSEGDMLHTSTMSANSPGDILGAGTHFDLSPSGHCGHENGSWQAGSAPMYGAFDAAYEMSYAVNGCDSHHHTDELCAPGLLNDPRAHTSIKHEEWDHSGHYGV